MKNNIVLNFTRILCVLFAIGTIITIFIVYRNIDSSIAVKFLIGYTISAFFLILYVLIVTILNSRRLKWLVIKKRLFRFIILFISYGLLNCIFNYILKNSHIDVFKSFSIALGVAFVGSFIDVIFLKKRED